MNQPLRHVLRATLCLATMLVAVCLGLDPARAIQLRWSTGATDLTVSQDTQAILIVQADSSEVTLPDSWTLQWTADSTGIRFSAFDPSLACLVDTAKVDSIIPASTPADSAANLIKARFCSDGGSNATTAYFLVDLPAVGYGKLKVVALDPGDTTQVIESNEVTFNGGIGGEFATALLSTSYTHDGSTIVMRGVGKGLGSVADARLVGPGGSWTASLHVLDATETAIIATASAVAAVPACDLLVQDPAGGVASSPVVAEPLSLPEYPLFTPSVMTDPDPNFYPRDFALFYTPGKTHVIYIRHNAWERGHGGNPVPDDLQEMEFGHRWTPDWVTWNQVTMADTTVLSTSTSVGPWDDRHVWAPYVVQRGLTFYLFYTGVHYDPTTGHQNQSVGVATSTDLATWTRNALPSWSADSLGIEGWADGEVSGFPYFGSEQCRDPFVMEDPTQPGKWLLYYVAVHKDRFPDMVVGVARSMDTSLVGRWEDVGPILTTDASHTYETQIESPHAFYDHGRWWLFFSEAHNMYPISLETNATKPFDEVPADSVNWGIKYRLRNYLLGHSADASATAQYWVASEYMNAQGREFLAGWDGYGVRIAEMQWWSTAPDSFTLIGPTGPLTELGVGSGPGMEPSTRLYVANPLSGSDNAKLVVELPKAGVVQVVVFDVLGRRIRSLVDGRLSMGRTEIEWDGRGESSSRVGSGLYFVRLRTDHGDRVARLPLIR